MPELKALPPGAVKGFTAAAVDLETIRYGDKVREKARLVRLAAKKDERAKAAAGDSGRETKSKLAVSAAAKKPRRGDDGDNDDVDDDEDDDDDDDDGGIDANDSDDSDDSSNSGSSSDSSQQAKPSATKRARKGRKKVFGQRSVLCNQCFPSNLHQGAEGAWSIKKAKLAAKRKRKVSASPTFQNLNTKSHLISHSNTFFTHPIQASRAAVNFKQGGAPLPVA